MKNKLFSLIIRIKTDISFKIKLFLCLSFTFNLAYSIFLFVVGKITFSKWFLVTSAYYGLLSLVRIFIFKRLTGEKRLITKIKSLRACGYFLLLINLVFSAMTFVLLRETSHIKHHEITVITLATYTFSALTIAIVNSVKFIKRKDRLYACAKLINLISASVSLVTLTNTMLATFGEQDSALLRSIILPLLCAAVSVFIIATAILMIRKANLDLRNYNNEEKRR